MPSHLFFSVISVFFIFSCAHFQPPEQSKETQSKHQEKKESFGFLVKGLDLFKKKKFSESRKWLEKLNHGDEGFLLALLEIQKINYIEEDWDPFFGLASYYRKKFLYSPEKAAANFRQNMLALEILALIRHCRLPEALQVIEWSLALAKNIKKEASRIQKTIHLLKLKTQLGEKKIQSTDWKKQINLWPVAPENINRLNNPKYLRMKVDSKC